MSIFQIFFLSIEYQIEILKLPWIYHHEGGGKLIEGFFNTNARTCGFINFKEESSGKTKHGDKINKKKKLPIIK